MPLEPADAVHCLCWQIKLIQFLATSGCFLINVCFAEGTQPLVNKTCGRGREKRLGGSIAEFLIRTFVLPHLQEEGVLMSTSSSSHGNPHPHCFSLTHGSGENAFYMYVHSSKLCKRPEAHVGTQHLPPPPFPLLPCLFVIISSSRGRDQNACGLMTNVGVRLGKSRFKSPSGMILINYFGPVPIS